MDENNINKRNKMKEMERNDKLKPREQNIHVPASKSSALRIKAQK